MPRRTFYRRRFKRRSFPRRNYRRVQYKRRRVSRYRGRRSRLTRNRSTGSSRSTTRVRGRNPITDELLVKLPYYIRETNVTGPNGVNGSFIDWHANTTYDVDSILPSTQQPAGFSQYMALYYYHQVQASKIYVTITVLPTSAPMKLYLMPYRVNESQTYTERQLQTMPYVKKFTALPPEYGNNKSYIKMRHYMRTNTIEGSHANNYPLSGNAYNVTNSANISTTFQWQWRMYVYADDPTQDAKFNFQVTVIYYSRFHTRRNAFTST